MNKENIFSNPELREKREKLKRQLKARGINDENVLSAFSKVPREFFVSEAYEHNAYEDRALPIDCGQTISQPYTIAYMLEELNVNPGDKVLEIGSGSGYQAALLYSMDAEVCAVEKSKVLLRQSERRFEALGLSVKTMAGDGTLGWEEEAPFDGIIVSAAAPYPPFPLKSQLKIGGKLVIPVGDKTTQEMRVITRKGDSSFDDVGKDYFKFVPLIGEEGWEK